MNKKDAARVRKLLVQSGATIHSSIMCLAVKLSDENVIANLSRLGDKGDARDARLVEDALRALRIEEGIVYFTDVPAISKIEAALEGENEDDYLDEREDDNEEYDGDEDEEDEDDEEDDEDEDEDEDDDEEDTASA